MKNSKTVIITGSSRGIGAEIARRLSSDGYNVVLNYNKSENKAEALLAELKKNGGSCIAVQADVSVTDDVRRLFSEAEMAYGEINILVNNAGIAVQHMINDVTDAEWDRIMSVNIGGTFKCCREAVGYMLRNHSGSIINISSMWGRCGASCETVYSASKSAVIGFTKALAKELGPSGIRVNCVCPGLIDTEMNSMLSRETVEELCDETPLCRIGTPADIAGCVSFLAGEDSSFITGQIFGVDGGFVI